MMSHTQGGASHRSCVQHCGVLFPVDCGGDRVTGAGDTTDLLLTTNDYEKHSSPAR